MRTVRFASVGFTSCNLLKPNETANIKLRKMTKALTTKFILIVLLTVALTVFFYIHETFPKPIRAMTALLGTPTAIASGLSYYLKLGIYVFDTPIAVVFSNLIASILIIILCNTFFKWRNKRKQTTTN